MHFPFLAWIYFVFVAPTQWAFGGAAVAMFALLLTLVLAYAGVLWWLFERNTPRLRGWGEQRLFGAARAAAKVAG